MKKYSTIIICLILAGHLLAYAMNKLSGLDLFFGLFFNSAILVVVRTIDFEEPVEGATEGAIKEPSQEAKEISQSLTEEIYSI